MGRSFLAGLLIGLACYGYAATRIFIPAFLMSLTVALAPAWWRLVRSGQGRKATVALLVGVMIPFGPLAWMHVRYADEINIRARHLWAWGRDDPLSRKLEKAGERYAHHYNSMFLFQVGDEAIEIWPHGVGVLPWASLPLILLGIAVLMRPVGPPESRTATLVWLLLYPAGDILTFHYTANAMRAAPGMGIAAMLTALGMVACWRMLAQRHTRTLRLVSAVAVGFFFVVQTVSFIRYYFVGFPLEKSTRITFHTDLVEACEWLRPRRNAFQAIGFTTREFNQPYIVATTVLQTPPQRWHSEPRIFDMTGDWDTYHRVGDLYFLYHQSPDEWLASLRGEGVRGPAALVVRPGETTAGRLIHSICDPENNPRLEIRAVD